MHYCERGMAGETYNLVGTKPSAGSGILMAVGFFITAVLFGLVAVTANPMIVSLAAGGFCGILLFAQPVWNIWLIVSLGLLVAGVVPIWFDALASRAAWGISLLGFVLLASAWFRAITFPEVRRHTPAFVWIALAFMIYAVANTALQWHSAGEFLGGVKRYFQTIGLLFALAWLAIEPVTVNRLRRFFLFVAFVQLPFAVYELVALVPIRHAIRSAYPGMVPVDVVAGTFGASLYGGGANAEMATFLIIVLAFLLARFGEKCLRLRWLLLALPFVLAPLFLGETKVVVVLLPLMFLVLYRHELLARPHRALAGIVAGTVLTVAAGYVYVNLTEQTLDGLVDQTLRYNVYERGYAGAYLNRTTVLSFWAEQQGLGQPISAVFGNGLGSAHQATGGHVALRYPAHYIGLTAAATLLWDHGIVGTMIFLAIFVAAWLAAGRLRRETREAAVRADATAIQASLILFAFYLVYRLSLLEALAFQVVFYAMLGYLAWLYRRHISTHAA